MKLNRPMKEIYERTPKKCDKELAREYQLMGRGFNVETESAHDAFKRMGRQLSDQSKEFNNVTKQNWAEAPPPPPKLPDCCIM
jgi:hypothetical protein